MSIMDMVKDDYNGLMSEVESQGLNNMLSPKELDASALTFTPNSEPKNVPGLNDPIRKTWSYCTDHMVTASWTAELGWDAPKLHAYGPLAIMPNASVLHYATECFEGMKAYRGDDGLLRLFRPDCNARRMLISADRISLPSFDVQEFTKLVEALLRVDGPKFLPRSEPGQSIYIRPTMIGTHDCLGVQVPTRAMLFIIASYMADFTQVKDGLRLVASALDEVRAWPGGHGYAKVGANYAPTLKMLRNAQDKGYDQVLWLFGPEGKVTEVGGSNFFIVWKSRSGIVRLQTAPLSDKMILDGVVRRSILELARQRLSKENAHPMQLDSAEETFTMSDIVEAYDEGRVIEAFTCGTAYFVTPISEIHYQGKSLNLLAAHGEYKNTYAALFKVWLSDIMYGRELHHWAPIIQESQLANSREASVEALDC